MARMIDEVRAERVAAPRWVTETAGPPLLEVLDAIREKLGTLSANLGETRNE